MDAFSLTMIEKFRSFILSSTQASVKAFTTLNKKQTVFRMKGLIVLEPGDIVPNIVPVVHWTGT